MIGENNDFIANLRDGKEEALRAFYCKMVEAKSDGDFWSYLCSLTRGGEEEMLQLKNTVDARGFDWFLKNAPLHLLMVFLLAALNFAACDNSPPAVVPATTQTEGETPSKVAVESKSGLDDDTPRVILPTPPTAEELRTNLVEFIQKAELPASEKKRLLNIAARASASKLVDTEADLSSLFQKSSPEEIAEALEAMVMFKRFERKWEPAFGALYKGVSFS